MKKIVAMAFVTALAGCASYSASDLDSLISSGQCSKARDLVNAGGESARFYNLAVIAMNCEHDRQKARGYLEYAARNGNSTAVDALIRNGWPVPSPDIRAQSEAERQAGINLGLQLLQAGQAKPAKTVTCDTDKFGNGLQTTCR